MEALLVHVGLFPYQRIASSNHGCHAKQLDSSRNCAHDQPAFVRYNGSIYQSLTAPLKWKLYNSSKDENLRVNSRHCQYSGQF